MGSLGIACHPLARPLRCTHRSPVLLDDLRAEFVVVRVRHRVHELVAVRAQQPLERMADDQERDRVVLGALQLGKRDARILAAGQRQRHDVRLLEERRRVAGQYVEVIHPRRRGRFEDIAPDQVVLPANEELPRVRPMQRIVAGLVQPELVALGGQMVEPIVHAPVDALDFGAGQRPIVRPAPDERRDVQGDLFGQLRTEQCRAFIM